MNEDLLADNLNRIFETEPDDMTCQEARVFMAQLADASEEDRPLLEQSNPRFLHHLSVCEDCRMEYALVLEMAAFSFEEMEADVPARPDKQGALPKLKNLIEKFFPFPGFSPKTAAAVRGTELSYDPTSIPLADGLILELEPAMHEGDADRRDLMLIVDADAEIDLEGYSIDLVPASGEGKMITTDLDQYGEGLASALHMQTPYHLQLRIGKTLYQILDVSIP